MTSQIELSGLSKDARALLEEATEWGWRVSSGHRGTVRIDSPVAPGQSIALPKRGDNFRAAHLKTFRNKIHRYGIEPKAAQEAEQFSELNPEPPAPAPKDDSDMTMTTNVVNDQITTQIIDITPELALEWLTDPKYKAANRTIRKTKVAQYVKAMRDGKWKITGEAIKFDKNGKLIDGQHRLNAVIDADVTVQSLVVSGLEPETQDFMDTGAARDAKDVLGIHGVRHASVAAAAGRLMYAWDVGRLNQGQQTPKATNDEILDYVQKNPWLVELFGSQQADLRKVPMRGGNLLAALGLCYRLDADGAVEFLNKLANGVGLEEGDPILTLRDRLVKMTVNRESHSPYVMVSAVCRTFLAWRKQEPWTKLMLYYQEVAVPIPDEFKITTKKK